MATGGAMAFLEGYRLLEDIRFGCFATNLQRDELAPQW
jgi:hypothetical protein